MVKINTILVTALITLTPLHPIYAMEPIETMMQLQEGTLRKLQFATSRCGALFMSLTSRIESEITTTREGNTDPDIEANLKVAEGQLVRIQEIRLKFILWDQALSEELGEDSTTSSTSMINRAMKYNRHRQSVYVAPDESFTELEKQDVQTCGAVEKMLAKNS